MSFNPFIEQISTAQNHVSQLSDHLQQVKNEINLYEATDRQALQKQLDALQAEANGISLDFERSSGEIHGIKTELQPVLASRKSLWNPANWFDAAQRDIRRRAAKLNDSLRKEKTAQAKFSQALDNCKGKVKAQQEEIRHYDEFDFDAKNSRRSELAKQLSSKKRLVEHLIAKKNKVDTALEPIVKQVNDAKAKISRAQHDRRRAQTLERTLANAGNSYERAMTHQACENEFETGSPSKVISIKDAEIRRLERDLEKMEKRAKDIVTRAARDVKQLVIDGNNLCYEGDKFIGLDALKALVPALADLYKIQIVFDASIRRLLHSGDAEVRDAFGNAAQTHIVATKVKADETVLDLAGATKTAFVVSNDRFAEFQEKPTVSDDRFIRHEIVGGRIFIHDLGISETYRT